MAKYNSNIELTPQDMDLIEDALRQTKRKLSKQHLANGSRAAEADEPLRQIHDLLGRLHNQKVFYRPPAGGYVGG